MFNQVYLLSNPTLFLLSAVERNYMCYNDK